MFGEEEDTSKESAETPPVEGDTLTKKSWEVIVTTTSRKCLTKVNYPSSDKEVC